MNPIFFEEIVLNFASKIRDTLIVARNTTVDVPRVENPGYPSFDRPTAQAWYITDKSAQRRVVSCSVFCFLKPFQLG